MACRLLGSISPQHDSSRKFPLVNSPADSPQQVPRCISPKRHMLQLYARCYTWQSLTTGEKVETFHHTSLPDMFLSAWIILLLISGISFSISSSIFFADFRFDLSLYGQHELVTGSSSLTASNASFLSST